MACSLPPGHRLQPCAAVAAPPTPPSPSPSLQPHSRNAGSKPYLLPVSHPQYTAGPCEIVQKPSYLQQLSCGSRSAGSFAGTSQPYPTASAASAARAGQDPCAYLSSSSNAFSSAEAAVLQHLNISHIPQYADSSSLHPSRIPEPTSALQQFLSARHQPGGTGKDFSQAGTPAMLSYGAAASSGITLQPPVRRQQPSTAALQNTRSRDHTYSTSAAYHVLPLEPNVDMLQSEPDHMALPLSDEQIASDPKHNRQRHRSRSHQHSAAELLPKPSLHPANPVLTPHILVDQGIQTANDSSTPVFTFGSSQVSTSGAETHLQQQPNSLASSAACTENSTPFFTSSCNSTGNSLSPQQLTRAIQQCSDAGELQHLLSTAHLPGLNAVHISASFQRLTRLYQQSTQHPLVHLHAGSYQQQNLHAVLEQLSILTHQRLPSFPPRELSTVLRSSAILDYPLDPQLLEDCLQHFLTVLDRANEQDFAMVCWSLQHLQHVPSDGWLAAVVGELWGDGLVQTGRLPSFSTKALVITVNSLSKLEVQLSFLQVQRLARLLHHRRRQLSSQDLTNVLCSLARLQHPPEIQVMEGLMYQVYIHLGEFSGEELAMLAYALSKLKYLPSESYMARLQGAMASRFSTCSAGYLVLSVWAFGEMRQRPLYGWLENFLSECSERIQEFGPVQLSMLVYSLARFQYVPDSHIITIIMNQVSTALPAMDGRQLANVIWALPTLQHAPSDAWLRSFTQACCRCWDTFTSQGLVNLLWAFAKMQIMPPQQWCMEVLARFQQRLPDAAPCELSLMLWSLAKLRLQPDTRWLCTLLSAVQSALPRMLPNDIICSIQASSWLSCHTPRRLLVAYARALKACEGKVDQHYFSRAFARLRVMDRGLRRALHDLMELRASARRQVRLLTSDRAGHVGHASMLFGRSKSRKSTRLLLSRGRRQSNTGQDSKRSIWKGASDAASRALLAHSGWTAQSSDDHQASSSAVQTLADRHHGMSMQSRASASSHIPKQKLSGSSMLLAQGTDNKPPLLGSTASQCHVDLSVLTKHGNLAAIRALGLLPLELTLPTLTRRKHGEVQRHKGAGRHRQRGRDIRQPASLPPPLRSSCNPSADALAASSLLQTAA